MTKPVVVNTVINDEEVTALVEPRTSLLSFLRDDLALTAAHAGCEQGVCGACTVQVDGMTVRSCLVLAVQCDGSEVRTLEGMRTRSSISELSEAFLEHHALQCGFCTPGFLVLAAEIFDDLSSHDQPPSREHVVQRLNANICRCTGYQPIINAVHATLTAAWERQRGQ